MANSHQTTLTEVQELLRKRLTYLYAAYESAVKQNDAAPQLASIAGDTL